MSTNLYCRTAEAAAEQRSAIRSFVPRIWKLSAPGEQLGWKARLVRLYFSLIAGSRFRVFYYTVEDGSVVHTSCVLPKCLKFPYMEKGTFTIGPCSTRADHRGKGIYKQVLREILGRKEYDGAVIYMAADSKNIASIRGMEAAGFRYCGKLRTVGLLKRFYREET